MGISLGPKPEDLTVYLPRGGGFVAALLRVARDADGDLVDADWLPGAAVTLTFTAAAGGQEIAWPAVLTTEQVDGRARGRAQWSRTEAEVAAVLNSGTPAVRLAYTDTTTPKLVRGVGRVRSY